MEQSKKIWMDGKLVKWKDAKIHVLTHTLHYGAGVFEGIRFYRTDDGSAVFRLKDHVERLFYSSKILGMKIPFTMEQISMAVIKTVKANNLKEGYIRPIVYFGYGNMGVHPKNVPVRCAIAVWSEGMRIAKDALSVKTSKYLRIHPRSTHPEAKIIGHYVNSILAGQEAHKAGYDEALLLDYKGNVAEGSIENIFIVKHNRIYTPSPETILAGITRNSLIEIAKDEGYKVSEKALALDEVKNAEEAFFCATGVEIVAIKKIDSSVIGDGNLGPVTKKLRQLFFDAVHGKISKYRKWLTYMQ